MCKMLLARAKLVLTETTRQTRESKTLTVEQAMALVAAVTDAVRCHVTDQTTLKAIATDLNRITGRSDIR